MENKKLKNVYEFSSADVKLLPPGIVVNVLVFWLLGGVMIYTGIFNNHGIPLILVLILAAYFMISVSGLKYIYYRWLMLKYDKKSALIIDTTCYVFTYMNKEKTISFSPCDIDQWWMYECGPVFAKYVEILEIKLKNGEHIVISTGIGNAVRFIYYHSEELGFPKEYLADGQYERYKSFRAYIEQLERSV